MKLGRESVSNLLMKEIGERIAQRRLRERCTQEEFAAKSGISRSALQRLEHGDEGARLTTFLAALRSLGRLESLEVVLPEEEASPFEVIENGGEQVKMKRARKAKPSAASWRWKE